MARGGQKRARLPRLILNTKNVLVVFAGRLRTQGDTDITFSIHWKKKKKDLAKLASVFLLQFMEMLKVMTV